MLTFFKLFFIDMVREAREAQKHCAAKIENGGNLNLKKRRIKQSISLIADVWQARKASIYIIEGLYQWGLKTPRMGYMYSIIFLEKSHKRTIVAW